MNNKPNNYRIAIYIRVSTEEQAQNLEGSIKNQEQRLRGHVKLKNIESNFGEITEVYIDRAKSGKDTKRPALQKMLAAIRNNEIDLVLVSELSRISRSMKDFAEIWEMLQACNCGFQSLRENFDTTTAAGEMVLFSVANIAQFESRQVSERVSLNMNARAKRGLYNGGCVPFGYKLIKEKPGFLAVDEKQAKVVKKAFQIFLKEETLSRASKWLNTNGYRLDRAMSGGGRNMRLDQFTVDNLHHILRSKTYIGLRSYKEQGKTKDVKAVWEPIVGQTIFDRVQKLLTANKSRKKPSSAKRYPYLLSGITFCDKCSDPLSGKSAWGKNQKFGYYEHSWSTKKNSSLNKKIFDCGNPRRFSASKLQELVIAKINNLLNRPTLAKELLTEAQKIHKNSNGVKESEKLKAEIYGFSSQLDALAERLAQLPKTVSAGPIFKQMEKIEGLKNTSEGQLEQLKRYGANPTLPPIELKSYTNFLSGLKEILKTNDEDLKAKIIKRLVHRIEVGEKQVQIYYNVDKNSLLRDPSDLDERISLCPKSGKLIDFRHKKSDKKNDLVAGNTFLKNKCSNSLTNGARERT